MRAECPECKLGFTMDSQNTNAVCPWCGALYSTSHKPEPEERDLL